MSGTLPRCDLVTSDRPQQGTHLIHIVGGIEDIKIIEKLAKYLHRFDYLGLSPTFSTDTTQISNDDRKVFKITMILPRNFDYSTYARDLIRLLEIQLHHDNIEYITVNDIQFP